MLEFEFRILDFIQSIRTPLGDVVMPLISALGNAGMIWILLACILMALPRTRKSGVILAAALCWDVVLCNGTLKNLVARIRTYGGFVCVRHGTLFGREAETCRGNVSAGLRHSIFQTVSVCALPDGYSGRDPGGNLRRIYGILHRTKIRPREENFH